MSALLGFLTLSRLLYADGLALSYSVLVDPGHFSSDKLLFPCESGYGTSEATRGEVISKNLRRKKPYVHAQCA